MIAWHRPNDLAKRYGFTGQHVRRLIAAGAFGAEVLQVGRDIRVPAAGVDLFERTHTRRVFSRAFSTVEGLAA